jgi:N-acetylmuramoyl-L-alanine amidase CwlA
MKTGKMNPEVKSAGPGVVYPMVSFLINVAPKMEAQHKAMLTYQKALINAAVELSEDLKLIQNSKFEAISPDSIKLVSKGHIPVYPMINQLINVLPKMEAEQKAMIKYYKKCAKAGIKFLEKIDDLKVGKTKSKPVN